MSIGQSTIDPRTAKIFGQDDRLVVDNTTQYPFSAVGRIEADFFTVTRLGTGVLISKKWVLTVGHLIYDPQFGLADPVYFYPGANRDQEPYGKIKVAKVLCRQEWMDALDDAHDMALLELEDPVGSATGFFKIILENAEFFTNAPLTTAGYPEDKGGNVQITLSGTASGIDGGLIDHNLDVEPGQSGSPIWHQYSPQVIRLVGLIKGVKKTVTPFGTTERGVAVPLTDHLTSWIDRQLTESGDAAQDVASPPEPSIPCISSLAALGLAFYVVLRQ